MVVTTLPYLYALIHQGSDWRFSGFLIGSDDGNSYIAKMLLGAKGDWLFRTPYTPYLQQGFLAFFPYYLLGKLSFGATPHTQLLIWFQLFRLSGGFVFILATYDFVSIFIKEIKLRRLALSVITLGGGLAFLSLVGLGSLWGWRLPLEFYSPETFGFLEIYSLPHLAFSRAFLLWGLKYFLVEYVDTEWKTRIIGGVFLLSVGFMQPLTVVTGWSVMLVYLVALVITNWIRRNHDWKDWRKYFWRGFWLVLISSPMVLYNFVSFQVDPVLRSWQTQNIISSPPFTDYLLGFAVLLPLVVVGIIYAIKKWDSKFLLLFSWIVLFPILAYAPYNLQRRLPEGIWVALAILAVFGFSMLAGLWRKLSWAWLAISFTPLLVILAGGIISAGNLSTPLFLPVSEVQAFEYFAKTAAKSSVVIASFETSNALPAWAPVTVMIGHGPESTNLKQIQPQVESFYHRDTPDTERVDLIKKFNIKYIFVGPAEIQMGNWDPGSVSWTQLVFQEKGYSIFKVSEAHP